MTGGRQGSASASPGAQSASSSSRPARRRTSSSATTGTPRAPDNHLWAIFEPLNQPAIDLGPAFWSASDSRFGVGRGTGNNLHLEKAAKCSGQHATFIKLKGESPPDGTAANGAARRVIARLKDHSSNGTHVNGVKIRKADTIIRDGDFLVFGPLATPENPFEICYRIVYAGPPFSSPTPLREGPLAALTNDSNAASVSDQGSSPIASDGNPVRKRKRTTSPPVQLARVHITEAGEDRDSAGPAEATQHMSGTSPAIEAGQTLKPIDSLDKPDPDGTPLPPGGSTQANRIDASATTAPSPADDPPGSVPAPAESGSAALAAGALAVSSLGSGARPSSEISAGAETFEAPVGEQVAKVGATIVDEDVDEMMEDGGAASDNGPDIGSGTDSPQVRTSAGHEGPRYDGRQTSLMCSQDDSEFDTTMDIDIPLTDADLDQLLIDLREQGVPWPDVVSQVGLSLGEAQARHQSALEARLAAAAAAAAKAAPRGRIASLSGSKRPWTAEEDARLADLKKKRFKFKVISQMMTARTESACQARWHLIKATARAAEAATAQSLPSTSSLFSYSTSLASPLAGSASLARAQSTSAASFISHASPSSARSAFVPLPGMPSPLQQQHQSSHDSTTQQAGPSMLPVTSVQSMIEEAVEAALRRRDLSVTIGPSGSIPPPPPGGLAPVESPNPNATRQKQETPAAVPMADSPSAERKPNVAGMKEPNDQNGLLSVVTMKTATGDECLRVDAATATALDAAATATAPDAATPQRDGATSSHCTCVCHANHDDGSARIGSTRLMTDPAVVARVQQTMEEVSALLDQAGASFSRLNALRNDAKKREGVETVV